MCSSLFPRTACSVQAYDRSCDLPLYHKPRKVKHRLLYKAWTDRAPLYCTHEVKLSQ
jgi:hypothetical protein